MQSLSLDRPAGLSERRLTARVRKSWAASIGEARAKGADAGARLPSWETVRKFDLGDDWRSCFAVDLALSDPDPYFIYLGEDLDPLMTAWLSEDSIPGGAAIDMVLVRMDEAVLAKASISFETVAPLHDGRRIAFRSVILPLSDNGVDVTHVFGAANGRFLGRTLEAQAQP